MIANSWLAATYIDSQDFGTEFVKISIVRNELIIRKLDEDVILARWPISSLTQHRRLNGRIALQWLPSNALVEFEADHSLATMPWKNKLPGQIHKSTISKGVVWLLLAAILPVSFFALLPMVAYFIPWQVETYIFNNSHPFNDDQYCSKWGSGVSKASFDKIIERIYPIYEDDLDFPLNVHVIRGNEINAFAAPGGAIFIFNSLISQADSPEEVAGILAHEIQHVKQRHVMEKILRRFVPLLLSNIIPGANSVEINPTLQFIMHTEYFKNQEYQADLGAVQRLVDAGVNVTGISNFFSKKEKGSADWPIFSDHPSYGTRIKIFEAHATADYSSIISEHEWQQVKRLCE